MDDFSISRILSGDVAVVTVAGRVDSFTAATLDAELAKIVQENKKLVLDLKDMAYLSSAGVRAIMRALQTAQRSGGGVKLARVPALVDEVLQTVGVMQILDAHPSVDDAVAAF